jgi:predicted acylesterase/phospholipase RssA
MNSPLVFTDLEQISLPRGTLYDSGYIAGQVGDPDIEFVNFSGGGLAGAAFAGVLKEMEARGLYCPKRPLTKGPQWTFDPLDPFYKNTKSVKYWIGSSAGGMIAAMAAMGAPPDYIIEQLLNTDTNMFMDYGGRDQSNAGWSLWNKFLNYRYGVTELISRWGTVRGARLNQWFRDQMNVLGWSPKTTFTDLYDLTGQHLVITATSLNTFETLYLSRSSYPYMRIIDAIDATVRLPVLFQPVYMQDPLVPQGKRVLSDGGILDNLPINACDLMSETGELLAINRRAIGFTLVNEGKWVPDYTEIDGILKYSLTFVKSLHTRMHVLQSHQPYFWDRVIPIETHGLDSTNFDVDKSKLQKVIFTGQKAARDFLNRRQAMIQTNGPLPRNLFIPGPRLQNGGIQYISDDLLENTMIYQTNGKRFKCNKLPRH